MHTSNIDELPQKGGPDTRWWSTCTSVDINDETNNIYIYMYIYGESIRKVDVIYESVRMSCMGNILMHLFLGKPHVGSTDPFLTPHAKVSTRRCLTPAKVRAIMKIGNHF
jgi:hypothetical protein